MKRISKLLALVLCIALLATLLAACGNSSSTATEAPAATASTTGEETQEPIKIGVPLPLTGGLSETGQRILGGIQYCVDEYNAKGGVLGRQVEIVVEDTASDINTASQVAEKLITSDKVFAMVGGYGSTVDYGMMQNIAVYEPLFIHTGSTTVKLEQDFGAEDWYYHLYIWDYHRQSAFAKAITSLTDYKNVAILYEDGNFGATSYEYAKKYLPQYGLNIVMAESFSSGSADFSGMLNKVKDIPGGVDVIWMIGYANDNISIPRQAQELDIPYKLFTFVGLGNVREDFGEYGNNLCYLDAWSAQSNVEGLSDFVNGYESATGQTCVSTTAQGYASMEMMLEAIKIAGKVDKQAVMDALNSSTFDTPFGSWPWSSTEIAKHNYLTEDNMVLIQYQGDKEVVVYPESLASGKIITLNQLDNKSIEDDALEGAGPAAQPPS